MWVEVHAGFATATGFRGEAQKPTETRDEAAEFFPENGEPQCPKNVCPGILKGSETGTRKLILGNIFRI